MSEVPLSQLGSARDECPKFRFRTSAMAVLCVSEVPLRTSVLLVILCRILFLIIFMLSYMKDEPTDQTAWTPGSVRSFAVRIVYEGTFLQGLNQPLAQW